MWIFALYSLHRTVSNQTELSQQVSAYSCLLFFLYGSHTLTVLNTANTLMAEGKKASNFIHKTLIRVRDDEVKKRVRFKNLFFIHRLFVLLFIQLFLSVDVFLTAASASLSHCFMWIFFCRLARFIFGLFIYI